MAGELHPACLQPLQPHHTLPTHPPGPRPLPLPADGRALWLPYSVIGPNGLSVTMPPARENAPPGMYYLVLLSDKGVPSVAKIISLK